MRRGEPQSPRRSRIIRTRVPFGPIIGIIDYLTFDDHISSARAGQSQNPGRFGHDQLCLAFTWT
jgi:hypothetical protein